MKKLKGLLMKHAILATALCLGVFCSDAQAALIGTTGSIPNLRAEGSYGFIGLSAPLPGTSCGDVTRVWVNMTTDEGRAAYATAMLAFSQGLTIYVRANDTPAQIFGVCQLYDIYVTH